MTTTRFGRGIKEAMSTQNRRIGNYGNSNYNANSSGYVGSIQTSWATITSTQIQIGTPTTFMCWAYVNFSRTAGTLGDTFFAEIQKDSDADNSQLAFPTDASFQFLGVPNDQLSRGMTLVAKYLNMQPGIHTIRVKCSASGDTFQALATLDVLALGDGLF